MTGRLSGREGWAASIGLIYIAFVLSLMFFLPLEVAGSGTQGPYWSSTSGGSCNRYLSSEEGARNLGGTEWEVDLGEDLDLALAVGNDGTIFSIERGGHTSVHAIGPGGRLEWESDYGLDELHGPSVSPNGSLILMGYSRDHDHSVLMMLDGSGLPVYVKEYPGRTFFPPVADERGGILIGTYEEWDDRADIIYIGPSGDPEWNVTFEKPRYHEPGSVLPAISPDGRVYFTASFMDDHPMCISPNGTLLWGGEAYLVESGPPLINHDENVIFEVEDGLLCLDPDGETVWRTSLARSPSSNLALSREGLLYFFSGSDRIVAVDSATGEIILDRSQHHEGDRILLSRDGTVFGIGWDTVSSWERDGSDRWHLFLWEDVHDIVMGKDGTLIVSTESGIMALKGDDNSTILAIAWVALVVLSIVSLLGIACLYRRWTVPPHPVLPSSVLGPSGAKRVRCTRCSNIFPVPDGIRYITCPRCGLVSREIW